jgi:uncharacterized membrane protein
MKVIVENENKLIIKEGSMFMPIIALIFLIIGAIGSISSLIAGIYDAMLLIMAIFFVSGLLGVLLIDKTEIILDKSSNKMTVFYKKLIGTKSNQYDFSEIKEISINEGINRIHSHNNRPSQQIVFYFCINLNSGKIIRFVVYKRSSGMLGMVLGPNSKAVQDAETIAGFLNVPFKMYKTPDVGDMLKNVFSSNTTA